MLKLKGVSIAPGISIGRALIKEKNLFSSTMKKIKKSDINNELNKFEDAVEKSKQEIISTKNDIEEKIGKESALIFESHLLLMEDKIFLDEVRNLIKKNRIRADAAILKTRDNFNKIFESIEDKYIKERVHDVCDVLTRIYKNIKKEEELTLDIKKRPSFIIITHQILPSEVAELFNYENIVGLAVDHGSKISHAVLLARSLGIPVVIDLKNSISTIKNDDLVIIDGIEGEIIINPSPSISKKYAEKMERYKEKKKDEYKIISLPSVTLDGFPFFLYANIELPEEVKSAFSYGAEGIGLFRTEYLYLHSKNLPTEEEQFSVYSKMAEESFPKPLVIRILDVGGDKKIVPINEEPNPTLGLRSIRLLLKRKDILRSQIKAIIRASYLGNVKILIPMVTELSELISFKELVEETKNNLKKRNIHFDDNIPVGVMIEVPAAAYISDILAKNCDFLSIGTNDLIQYTLAIDRTNQEVSYLYKPLHPSILRTIQKVVESAKINQKEIYVCGEMASDSLYTLTLLGLGINFFSMNPFFIPKIKKVLRRIEKEKITEIVTEVFSLSSAEEIEKYLYESIDKKFLGILKQNE
ncbi:MAG: phosphoenolpyruvate--protein phosphotransferase [Acidobacteriota bacterium]